MIVPNIHQKVKEKEVGHLSKMRNDQAIQISSNNINGLLRTEKVDIHGEKSAQISLLARF